MGFLDAYASARPRIIQLTTIKLIQIPSEAYKPGTNACRSNSTTVTKDTLDEAPFAYKNINDILNNIVDTVEVVEIIKPIYNFKASEKFRK